MYESGQACLLDCVIPTQSTSSIHGLVRFFVSFRLVIIDLIEF
jgi:hypothetical protein